MKAKTKKRIIAALATPVVTLIAVLFIMWMVIAQPSCKQSPESKLTVSQEKLKAHVDTLSIDFHPRNYLEIENQSKTAQYIFDHFKAAGAKARFQGFTVKTDAYQNVVGVFNEGAGNKLIIGAHYDSCADTPGADDNASGVAGLIELAYMIGKNPLDCEIELVGYTLEEPPFFRSESMGSYQHALKLENKDDVQGVLVLEMIGYFTDEEDSQEYPTKALKAAYPSVGNYIAVISKSGQASFTKKIKNLMQGRTPIPIYSLNAPAFIPGVDYSDHRNYWDYGINAVMITDTSFYRNKNYHELSDTSDTLDYEAMAHVVIAVYETIIELGNE